MKLHAIKFGLAWGVFYAFFMIVLVLIAVGSGWGAQFVELYGTFFFGVAPSLVGVLAGAIWGFVIGFILGSGTAWLYNIFL